MSLEIRSAANFIVHLVKISKHNICEYQLKRFNKALVKHLKQRYYDHWNPEYPLRGSGYRCIRINQNLDMNIELAGQSVGLSSDVLYSSLPKDLIIWIVDAPLCSLIFLIFPIHVMSFEAKLISYM